MKSQVKQGKLPKLQHAYKQIKLCRTNNIIAPLQNPHFLSCLVEYLQRISTAVLPQTASGTSFTAWHHYNPWRISNGLMTHISVQLATLRRRLQVQFLSIKVNCPLQRTSSIIYMSSYYDRFSLAHETIAVPLSDHTLMLGNVHKLLVGDGMHN